MKERIGAYLHWLSAVAALVLLAETCRAQEHQKLEIVPQIPHSGVVDTIAFTHDGARAVSASWDGTLKLWDVATGRLIRSIYGNAGGFFSVAFSPDATQLLAGERQGVLTLFDAYTGKPLRKFEGHVDGILAVTFSRDGTQAVSAGHDRTIRLWSVATGKLLRRFVGHSDSIVSVELSPDATRLLSGSADKTARLWDVATGGVLRTLTHAQRVSAAVFSPDATRILTGGFDRTLKLWDADTGQLTRTFQGHTGWVHTIAFSPDGKSLVSGAEDKTIKLWDANTGAPLRTLTGQASSVASVAFSADGTLLLSGGRDGELVLWHAAEGHRLRAFGQPLSKIASVAYSPNGGTVISGSADTTVKLWNVATGQLINVFKGHSGAVKSVAFSPNGARIISGSDDKTVKLWDAETGKAIHTFEGHGGLVYSVAFSPSGKQLLSGDRLGVLRLWDADTGKLLRSIEAHPNNFIASVAFSTDGSRMLSGSSDRTLKLWDTESGNLLRTFNGHSDRVWTVGFSPDGVHVLSGSFDRTAKLWDANTGQLLHTFDGHSGWAIRSVAFSPTGAQLATADSNGEIHLWNTASRELVRTLHSTPADSVAFSPDGRRLVTGGDDTTTKIWDLTSGSLLASLSATADGDWLAMTPAGFFSASRSATDMLGVVRGYDYWSIQQFYEHLYRPDLFDEVMKGDPEGKHKDEAFRLNLEKILEAGPAPQIEHLKQRDGRAGDTIQLTVRLTDTGGGIGKKVVWRINGQTRAVSTSHTSGGATDKASTVTTSLRVDPGQNTLVEVTAYNRAELLATPPLQIRVDKFGATAEERPSMHVLAIGVNKYRMADFQLRYAVKDATAIGEALAKVGGALLGSDNVFVTTLTDEQVSAHNIESAFGRIAARAKLGDVFVLFLSGHGKSIAGRYYYYPQTLDFSQGHKVDEHGIGQDALQLWIAGIPAQKKVLIIDTCESSAAAGLVRGDAPRRTAMDHLQHATGENLIAAARQAAFEGYQGHGVLTYALLEAMHKTEGRGNDQIRVSTLARFAERRVPEISYQLTGFDQKPTRKLTGDNFPIGLLATVLSPPTTDIVSKTPTHVLVRIERVRVKPEAGAQGERELAPGAQVRIVKFDGAWAMVAIDGQELGYVPSEALARLH